MGLYRLNSSVTSDKGEAYPSQTRCRERKSTRILPKLRKIENVKKYLLY